MPHLILLGDSIFDNGVYVDGGPDVCSQLRDLLPATWRASLLAVDGAVCRDVVSQLAHLPADASQLVLSVGGNDALMRRDVLAASVQSSVEAILLMADAMDAFEHDYRQMMEALLATGLPLTVCTIYNANFDAPDYQRCVRLAVAVFNDVILRVAAEHRLPVIDLRAICNLPGDYANPIEPSVAGGEKISRAILDKLALH
ncbi:SGNH/GDSL hydrolase family protein [Methylophilus aquaticus]|uniref:SGNH/GDSL hydrolase family protein n=1 Tax=Methylophilus aquaticus TaxID=1971610 RepID=A0ABT9JR87_9PROT|nr:SGNH/GDSL hydrolase family protein [Methylophilus aquaticus]MDP8567076.1 SGNH/GDSL hydrolase family protein [Methylophilus aquaticus]